MSPSEPKASEETVVNHHIFGLRLEKKQPYGCVESELGDRIEGRMERYGVVGRRRGEGLVSYTCGGFTDNV